MSVSVETTKVLAPDKHALQLVTLTNQQGMRVQFIDWGATWVSCVVPVGDEKREVLLGCKLEDYAKQGVYFGATIGRYANRIANSQFDYQGQTIKLTANQGSHQLHGGPIGFDKRRWQIEQTEEKCGENGVIFSLTSPDGEQGFVGTVKVQAIYRLTDDNALIAEFKAISDQDTPLNLTNHAYFNLYHAEQGSDIREHLLQLNAAQFVPVDSQGIPNAPLKSVQHTSFDFRQAKAIKQDFLQDEQQLTKGYDHAFLLGTGHEKTGAILTAPDGSLRLTLTTSQPALQVYTGNYLQGTPTRAGGEYADYTGIALETQALPDTPNHPEWWQYGGMVKAGETYQQWTRFQFG
ncbi:galactose-1-epimerase [Lonepinella sp. BR2357]|uniref:galactose-1-epimerase n=1 Tax=Lonepinella sp. BR2357 TaxID=3434549 RepID=UPI003F6E071D